MQNDCLSDSKLNSLLTVVCQPADQGEEHCD